MIRKEQNERSVPGLAPRTDLFLRLFFLNVIVKRGVVLLCFCLLLLSQLSEDEDGADQCIKKNESHQNHHPGTGLHIAGHIHGGKKDTRKGDEVGGNLEIQTELFDIADAVCRCNAKGKKGDDPDLFSGQTSCVEGQREEKGQQCENTRCGKKKF